jgi:hypothetical protein
LFSHFSFVKSGATIAGAFQFSNKQGLRDRSSDEKKQRREKMPRSVTAERGKS